MKYTTAIIFILILIPTISATSNLDFRLDTPDKLFYPNEKIPLNVSVINRDSTFSAKDAILTVNIGQRFYNYDLGTLKPGERFEKEITLPEFPAGTQTIRGVINYTGILDEKFIEESYGSFEVLFPLIERYPRNVYVSNYDLPEKILSGKTYDVSITVINDGEVNADLLIEFGSLDEFFNEKKTLKPQESATVKMTVKFTNSGVSLIEARAYALINGEKYLLNYRGQKTFVQEERIAKLSFDKIEYIDEPDNAINQEDKVKLKIFINNLGDTATDVKAELSSNIDKVNIIKSNLSYMVIGSKDSSAPSNEYFEIETKGAITGQQELNLKINYVDSENREKTVKIPITITEGTDSCKSNNECSNKQLCENNKCVEIPCSCGYVTERKCVKYSCCEDKDCSEFKVCNSQIHECVMQTGCLKAFNSGASNDKADILVIGAEYKTAEELKSEIDKLFDIIGNGKNIGFFDVEPFKSNKNKFNIWMIPAPDYSTHGSGSCGQSCNEAVDFSQDAKFISQCPNVDTTITIFKSAKFRSCAGGGQWSSLSCQDESDQGKLILHESGHSFGHLADEYIEASKGSYPWGPNCASTKEEAQQKWGDLIGKQGIGFFSGCSYTDNNIRPTDNSLMKSHYSANSYGLVNERAISKILEGYK